LLALLIGSCASPIDGEQLHLCRLILPALHADGSEIREIRVSHADLGRQGLQIEYSAQEPGQERSVHHVVCGFGGTAFERGRLDLVALETDGKPWGVARLLFLKRFWLSQFGLAAQVEAHEPPPPVPQLPRGVAYGIQQATNAVALAGVYALLATAYSLIYGLVGRINLAFGEIAVVGAYGAISGVAIALSLGLGNPIAGLAAALAAAGLVAALASWLVGSSVVVPLHMRYRLGQPILVATIAVAITIQEFLRLTQGVRERWFPPTFNEPIPLARSGTFVVTMTPIQLAVSTVALVAALTVLWLLAKTRFGREWRAYADDPAAAALVGVAPQRVMAVTFILAGALAGLAGWIIAVYYGNVSFSMGTILGLKALVAAVVGGIGSVPGAFLGGIMVALIEAAWAAYFDITMRDIVVFSLLIVVFVLRPGGLLGLSGPSPREV
jgi:branched-chain amino acid transport system permease protein